METSTLLMIGSLGSIAVLLMLYGYIFTFERRNFLLMWFVGWLIIALDYSLEAFGTELLKQNKVVFLLSLISFFYANLLIVLGTLIFLKVKVKAVHFIGIGIAWLLIFIVIGMLDLPPVHMILIMYTAIFALFTFLGITMIRMAKRYGRLILVLGLLNIAWVINTLFFSYIMKMPHMGPYVVSQLILLLNAIGLIQLYFKVQNDAIREGLDYITYLTFHDGLTGLFNKTYFDSKLHEIEGKKEYLPISLIVGDMNGLKYINDVFGHHEGDNRLKKMALIIQQACREKDIIARWGGDEFTVILPNTDKETAKGIGDKISAACKSFQGTDLLLSLSLGVATMTDDKSCLSAVFKEAEELMYQDKLIESRKVKGAIAATLEKVLQANDDDMKEHMARVKRLAIEFAKVLDLSAEDQEILSRAATLHDVGKIGISKDMMSDGTLPYEEEGLNMRKHVEIGYRIAQASGEFAHLADIILYHHEWWNGQGYPQGLKGEEIPLVSRIISILNAFDLMTHQQQDRPAMPTEEALQELESKAGSQFDPSLVQLFIQMVKDISDSKEAEASK